MSKMAGSCEAAVEMDKMRKLKESQVSFLFAKAAPWVTRACPVTS